MDEEERGKEGSGNGLVLTERDGREGDEKERWRKDAGSKKR